MTPRVALIAHDMKKDDIVKLAGEFVETLAQCSLVAIGTTGSRIAAAHGLTVERKLSGPHGGDLQIGAELAEGRVNVVIFLRDPMTSRSLTKNPTSTHSCARATCTTCRARPTSRRRV